MNYNTVGLPERIGMLNEDQKRVFKLALAYLEHINTNMEHINTNMNLKSANARN